ncbi:MAG TPA: hypothetical protein VG347_15090 [Verrucomicrobiae bacterium]|nr:hypothetical protein [Verrucomicrobiae bacterium]
MNETPESKTGWRIRRTLLIWSALFIVIVLLMPAIGFMMHAPGKSIELPSLLVFAAIGASLWFPFAGLAWFIRQCCCWRTFRRVLLGVAILATLAATFYTEEYWRGKRAWDSYRQELEAKGAMLDWAKLPPAPVPDDQNFFMASTNMRMRFVKLPDGALADAAARSTWLSPSFKGLKPQVFSRTNAPIVAEITMIPPASPAPADSNGALYLQLGDTAKGEKIQAFLKSALGRTAIGSAGFHFTEHDLSRMKPAKIFFAASSPPSLDDLKNFVPPNLVTNIGRLQLEATIDPKIFYLKLVEGHVIPAADYLQWGEQFEPAWDEVREALKRPYAQIPGDYSEPYLIPIPNFVMMRWLAQSLAQRAQCQILLGHPEQALPDLAIIHDSCRILERLPTGKPMTLVEAMINVAITGAYTVTIGEGLRAHCWNDSELATLQAQLQSINLQPYLHEAFRSEQTHLVRLGERHNFKKVLADELFGLRQNNSFLERMKSYGLYGWMPQGWAFQNVKVAVTQEQRLLDCFDPSNELVAPKKVEQATREITSEVDRHTVFHLLANIAIPNFTKAFQTYAFNQTLANEAQIACALERYRLAHNAYPETLDALTPQFMDKIPVDIFGGEPLHYHRTADGSFLLYSVGWNETDDGGTPGTLSDPKKGDWLWQSSAN